MRLVVTGSAGFVGCHLVPALAHYGCDGVAVSRSAIETLPPGWSSLERSAVLEGRAVVQGAAWVVHLEVKQQTSFSTREDLMEFQRVNVEGTQTWLEWCSRNDVRGFVYFSTIKAVRPIAGGPVTETSEGPPHSPYGDSKWAPEQLVREWVRRDPRRAALILRPAVIYGSGNRGNIMAMANAIRRSRFFLIGHNRNIKSVIAIENVCAAVTHLLGRTKSGGCEVFNLADAESFSVREMDSILRQRCRKSGNSPSIPVGLAKLAAGTGDLISMLSGRPFPFNNSRLTALLEETHFSCNKLRESGFVHPVKSLSGL